MGYQVLVADDSTTMQQAIAITFSQNPEIQLTAALSAEEALAKAKSLQPDLALIDLSMPDMDGYALCAALKNDQATHAMPVVLMAGKNEIYDEPKAQESGADTHVVKPFETHVLLERVRTLLSAKGAGASQASASGAVAGAHTAAGTPAASAAVELAAAAAAGTATAGVGSHLGLGIGLDNPTPTPAEFATSPGATAAATAAPGAGDMAAPNGGSLGPMPWDTGTPAAPDAAGASTAQEAASAVGATSAAGDSMIPTADPLAGAFPPAPPSSPEAASAAATHQLGTLSGMGPGTAPQGADAHEASTESSAGGPSDALPGWQRSPAAETPRPQAATVTAAGEGATADLGTAEPAPKPAFDFSAVPGIQSFPPVGGSTEEMSAAVPAASPASTQGLPVTLPPDETAGATASATELTGGEATPWEPAATADDDAAFATPAGADGPSQNETDSSDTWPLASSEAPAGGADAGGWDVAEVASQFGTDPSAGKTPEPPGTKPAAAQNLPPVGADPTMAWDLDEVGAGAATAIAAPDAPQTAPVIATGSADSETNPAATHDSATASATQAVANAVSADLCADPALRAVVERVAWDVVPQIVSELAEQLIKARLDELTKNR